MKNIRDRIIEMIGKRGGAGSFTIVELVQETNGELTSAIESALNELAQRMLLTQRYTNVQGINAATYMLSLTERGRDRYKELIKLDKDGDSPAQALSDVNDDVKAGEYSSPPVAVVFADGSIVRTGHTKDKAIVILLGALLKAGALP